MGNGIVDGAAANRDIGKYKVAGEGVVVNAICW